MTKDELVQLQQDAAGFAGRFEFRPDDDAGYDRLVYVSAGDECDDYEIAEQLEQHVAEPIARMLNTVPALLAHVEQLAKERDALATRRDELLAAMVRVANETPFADEAKDALAQRGKLIAEIGMLKAKLADAHEQLDACCERCLDKCPHMPKEDA